MLNKVIVCIGGDDKAICEVINATKLAVKFSNVVYDKQVDGTIVSLKIGKGALSLFDQIDIPIDDKIKSVYRIVKIEKSAVKDRSYNLYSSEETKTTQFILPILSDSTITKDYFLYDTFFENAYLRLSDETTKLGLVLLYRYSESEIYKSFETRIKNHPLFLETKDVNKSEVAFIFDISNYFELINLFIMGKYSKFDTRYKAKILNFFNYSRSGVMSQILNKSSILREQMERIYDVTLSSDSELYSKPDMDEEVYDVCQSKGKD